MTEFDATALRNGILLIVGGMLLRGIIQGHWVDWTQPVENLHKRASIWILTAIMILYGFAFMVLSFAGPLWALVIITSIAVLWVIYYNGNIP